MMPGRRFTTGLQPRLMKSQSDPCRPEEEKHEEGKGRRGEKVHELTVVG